MLALRPFLIALVLTPFAYTQQANDTFTDTPGTALASHTPNSGSSPWNPVVGTWTIGTNDVTVSDTNADTRALNPTTLADKQRATFVVNNATQYAGVLLRMNGV